MKYSIFDSQGRLWAVLEAKSENDVRRRYASHHIPRDLNGFTVLPNRGETVRLKTGLTLSRVLREYVYKYLNIIDSTQLSYMFDRKPFNEILAENECGKPTGIRINSDGKLVLFGDNGAVECYITDILTISPVNTYTIYKI